MNSHLGKKDSFYNRMKKKSAPRFIEDFTHIKQLYKGQKAELSVLVSGIPRPSLTWYKNNQPIAKNTRRVYINPEKNGRHSLVINEVQSRDEGEYRVIATNISGQRAECITRITIIRESLSIGTCCNRDVEIETGGQAYFFVLINSTIKNEHYVGSWFKTESNETVQSTERILLENKVPMSSLLIKEAQLEDSGKYTCLVRGKGTAKSMTFKLKVKGRTILCYFLIGKKFDRQNCRKSGLVPKILSAKNLVLSFTYIFGGCIGRSIPSRMTQFYKSAIPCSFILKMFSAPQ